MPFADILNEALDQVRGAHFAGIVSTDGLGVDLMTRNGSASREQLEIELGELVASANATAKRLGSGSLHGLMLETELTTFIAAHVMPGYYAVIGIGAGEHMGRARFAVKQMAQRLQAEL